MNGQKAVKYTVDGTVIDSNPLIDFKDTVNMLKNAGKIDVVSHFYLQFLLTCVNFMSPNLTTPNETNNLHAIKMLFFSRNVLVLCALIP